MRSVRVVFPASMCAIIPMFLVFSSENSLGMVPCSPVCFLCFLFFVLFSLFCFLFFSFPYRIDQPAYCQRLPSLGRNFHRDLVVGSADSSRLKFQKRLDIFYSQFKGGCGILALFLNHL